MSQSSWSSDFNIQAVDSKLLMKATSEGLEVPSALMSSFTSYILFGSLQCKSFHFHLTCQSYFLVKKYIYIRNKLLLLVANVTKKARNAFGKCVHSCELLGIN